MFYFVKSGKNRKMEVHSRKKSIVSGFEFKIIKFLIQVNILIVIFTYHRNIRETMRSVKKLHEIKRAVRGENKIIKYHKADRRYFIGPFSPGWPSVAFNNFIKGMAKKISDFNGNRGVLQTATISLTKKCPLKCEHCFEANELNKKEVLTLVDLKTIIGKLYQYKISNIHFAGAEPMLRYIDLIQLLQESPNDIDFWIYTSGFGLTKEKARYLKKNGLTGVLVSLDHFDEASHDKFRGYKGSFQWAIQAINNASDSGLATGITLCATKEFVSLKNMEHYLSLAINLGVGFIQILPPQPKGNYFGKDVSLGLNQYAILEDFYLVNNYGAGAFYKPVIFYHQYYQDRIGCFSGGINNVYIDTNGDFQACPFCSKSYGNACKDDLVKSIIEMGSNGCQKHEGAISIYTNQ